MKCGWRTAEKDKRAGKAWLLWTVLCRRVLGCLHFLPLFFLFVYLFACLFSLCSLLDEVLGLFIQRPKAWWSESQTNPSLPFCYPHLLLLTGYLLLLLFWQAELSSSHSSSSIAHLSLSRSPIFFTLSFGNFSTEKQDKRVRESGG